MPNKCLFKKFILLLILYTIFFINSSKFYIYAQNLETNQINQSIDLQNKSIDLKNQLINPQNQSANTTNDTQQIELIAESAVLMDAKTGIVLYDKNMNEKKYPASITKILTTLIALEKGNLTDTVKHSHNAIFNIGPGSSNMGMKENEELLLKDALYGIMLKSANEISMAVAEYISGDVDSFVDLMNNRAKQLGAKNTHFANPHGYHDENHYTTSYDMALIMKEALKNPEFVNIISTKTYTIPATNLSPEKILTNSNKLILEDSPFYYEYCVGGKTGFTDKAGNTLVSYAKKGDLELIAVVLKSKGTEIYNDSKKLFEYGFSVYENKNIFQKNSFEKTIPVIQNFKDKKIDLGEAKLLAKSDLSLNLPKTIDITKITPKINLQENLIAPVNIGDVVGKIDFVYENNIISSVDIVSDTKIDTIPEKKLLLKETIKKIILIIIIIILSIILFIVLIIILGYISRAFFKMRRKRKRLKRKYKRN